MKCLHNITFHIRINGNWWIFCLLFFFELNNSSTEISFLWYLFNAKNSTKQWVPIKRELCLHRRTVFRLICKKKIQIEERHSSYLFSFFSYSDKHRRKKEEKFLHFYESEKLHHFKNICEIDLHKVFHYRREREKNIQLQDLRK